MSVVSLGFLFLLVVLGGVAAYAGDKVGRYLGKKRLRLGNLRPKHTAEITTFVAGAFGTLLVVALVAWAAEPVRVLLFESEQAQKRATQAEASAEAAQKRLTDTESRLNQATQAIAAQEERLARANSTLQSKTKEAQEAQRRAATFRQSAEGLRVTSTRLKGELGKSRERLSVLGTQREALEQEIRNATGRLQRITKDNQSIQQMNLELTAGNTRLEKQIQQAEQQATTLRNGIKDLETALAEANRQFDAAQGRFLKDLEAANSELERAKTELASTESRLEVLRSEQARLQGVIGDTRARPLVYSVNDELARIAIPANASLAEANLLVSAALTRAQRDAEARPTGLRLGERLILPDRDRERLLAGVSRGVAGQRDSMLVIIRSPFNTFEGEPVAVQLQVYRNPVIYRRDAVIMNVQVDGRQPPERIAQVLLETLSRELGPTASQRGMIPALGRPYPLGEVTSDQILDMVAKVKEAGIPIRVQLLAARDTRAGDELQVTFRLRP